MEELGGTYRLSSVHENQIRGAKHVTGDVFSLAFELVRVGDDGCRASVELVGAPD